MSTGFPEHGGTITLRGTTSKVMSTERLKSLSLGRHLYYDHKFCPFVTLRPNVQFHRVLHGDRATADTVRRYLKRYLQSAPIH
jgi:hypothetical protein